MFPLRTFAAAGGVAYAGQTVRRVGSCCQIREAGAEGEALQYCWARQRSPELGGHDEHRRNPSLQHLREAHVLLVPFLHDQASRRNRPGPVRDRMLRVRRVSDCCSGRGGDATSDAAASRHGTSLDWRGERPRKSLLPERRPRGLAQLRRDAGELGRRARRRSVVRRRYIADIISISNTRTAFGGMTSPFPRLP